jgi:hypothetical protein
MEHSISWKYQSVSRVGVKSKCNEKSMFEIVDNVESISVSAWGLQIEHYSF